MYCEFCSVWESFRLKGLRDVRGREADISVDRAGTLKKLFTGELLDALFIFIRLTSRIR